MTALDTAAQYATQIDDALARAAGFAQKASDVLGRVSGASASVRSALARVDQLVDRVNLARSAASAAKGAIRRAGQTGVPVGSDRDRAGRRNPGAKTCARGLEVQTLIFPRAIFTEDGARAWARSQGMRHDKTDVTDRSVRLRQRPPRVFVRDSFRTIPMGSEGVKAVVGCPLPGRESDKRGRRKT
jgi:hypothetical protein